MDDCKFQHNENNISEQHSSSNPTTELGSEPDRCCKGKRRAPENAQFGDADVSSIEVTKSINHDDAQAQRQEEYIAAGSIGHKNSRVASTPAQDSHELFRQGGGDGEDDNAEKDIGNANGVCDVDGSARQDIARKADS